VDEKDPSELVAALQVQINANAERLRRTREMVDVISRHLDSASAKRARRNQNLAE
jgi:hypothetical protein